MPNNLPPPPDAVSNPQSIILMHGLAASRHDWDLLLPEIQNIGYQAWVYELPGHGEAMHFPNASDYTFQKIYQHFEKKTSDFCPPAAHLIGHSLGGLLALQLTIRHPDWVRSLTLVNPFYSKKQLSPIIRLAQHRPLWLGKIFQSIPPELLKFLLRLSGESVRLTPAQREQIAADYKKAAQGIYHIPPSIPELASEFSGISVPTLVVWGQRDGTLSPDSFGRLVSKLPNGSAIYFPQAGHQPHISQPKSFNKAVLDFLESLEENQSLD